MRATIVDDLAWALGAYPEPAVLLPLGVAIGDRGQEESEPHEDWGEGAQRTDDRSHLVLEETTQRRRPDSSIHRCIGLRVFVGHGEIEEHRQNDDVRRRDDDTAIPVHPAADGAPIGRVAAMLLR
eukprot:scaffold130481_cov60-Phaeocystis_antarctica.AAC.1